MNNPQESPWAVDVAHVATRPGQTKTVSVTMPAPDGIGDEYCGIPQGADVTVEGRVESLAEGLLFSGSASAHILGSCSRCLTPLDDEQTVTLSAYFPYSADEQRRKAEQPAFTDDEGEDTYPLSENGTVMDLEALLRDSFVVSLPVQALCRPDCLGLCPECGVNLNDNPDHRHEERGELWNESLAALRAQLESEQDS